MNILREADEAGRREMEDAIASGEIAWHALPFTTHSELMDADLFRTGLSLSQRLDKRFGKRTIAAKFTDVPGHTRGIIPLLAEAGVQFLHIGVNPGSCVPSVPPLFRWQDPSGAEVVVMYESGYGSAFVLPGEKAALAFGHSIDNLGPQNEQEVDDIFDHLRNEFPDAQVEASTLNDFAKELQMVRSGLPVVTQEIGDSWIHGVGSDPLKVAQFRELLRIRKAWLIDSPALQSDKRFDRFQRKLLMIPEHTWGMDEKTFLGDHEAYSAEKFTAARQMDNFRTFEASWVEQRGYIEAALDELGKTQRGYEARKRLRALRPQRPDLSEWVPLGDSRIELPQFSVGIDPLTGALSQLTFKPGGQTIGRTPLIRWDFCSTRLFRQRITSAFSGNTSARKSKTTAGAVRTSPSLVWRTLSRSRASGSRGSRECTGVAIAC